MKSYEKYISKENIEKIHEKSLYILENIGIDMDNERACNILKKHGAIADGHHIKIPHEMVEKALSFAIPSFKIHTHLPDKPEIEIGNGSSLLGPASSNVYISKNHHIYKMSNEDIINQFKLSDTSPVTDFNIVNFWADNHHFNEKQTRFGSMAIGLKYSNKYSFNARPCMLGVPDDEVYYEYKKGIRIIKKFMGTENQDKIVHLGMMNTLSPLAYHSAQVDIAIAVIEEKQCLWVTPCAMPLMTAPASVASALAMTNAEILAVYVLCKLIDPNCAFIYGNTTGATDMRALQLTIGSPEAALIVYATAGLADLYHLPFRAAGGLSDAKDCDIQAGMESMMMLNATIDANADIVHHSCGTIGTFNVVSFEKYLADEEAYKMVRRIQEGINCDDSMFLIKDIEKIGPKGTFLVGKTPKIYRKDFLLTSYFNKLDPNQWQNSGAESIYDRLTSEVKKRIKNYRMPEISKEQKEILNDYLPEQYRERI